MFNELKDHVRFSIETHEIINILTNAGEYEIVGQTGYPFDKVSEPHVGNINNVTYPVVPVTLESNVRKLHEYLFGENGYQPTNSVREISNYVKKMSGKS